MENIRNKYAMNTYSYTVTISDSFQAVFQMAWNDKQWAIYFVGESSSTQCVSKCEEVVQYVQYLSRKKIMLLHYCKNTDESQR